MHSLALLRDVHCLELGHRSIKVGYNAIAPGNVDRVKAAARVSVQEQQDVARCFLCACVQLPSAAAACEQHCGALAFEQPPCAIP